MPVSVMHTVWYRVGGLSFKVFKVGFGRDGSYYVTAPYHPLNTAIAAKVRVNYAKDQGHLGIKEALEGALEIAVVDDDEHRLKLSHHPRRVPAVLRARDPIGSTPIRQPERTRRAVVDFEATYLRAVLRRWHVSARAHGT